MVKFIRFRAVAAPVVLLLSLSAPAVAQETPGDATPVLQLGPVVVHPSVALKEMWQDNIRAVETNKKSGFSTSIKPALKLEMPISTHKLSFDGYADLVRYWKYTEENKTYYLAGVLGDFNLGDRVNLKLGDTYNRDYEPYITSSTGISEWYDTNKAFASVKYALAEVSQLKLDYSIKSIRYEESDYRSRDENLLSAYFYYRVLPNTSAFLQYEFKNVDYVLDTSVLDSDGHSGLLGATWEISADANGTLKGGLLTKNYTLPEIEDFTTWVASVDLTTRLTENLSLKVVAKRDLIEPDTEGVRYYLEHGVSAELTVKLLERLSGTVRGSYSQEDYSDPAIGQTVKREDNIASAGVSLNYEYSEVFSGDFGYTYRQKDSNIPNSSPVENEVWIRITAAL